MKPYEQLHNTLIYRELLPPPISLCNVNNNHSIRLVNRSLLHQAFAFCGRAFCVMLLALLPLGFSSCEKPDVVHGELEGYYDESTRLCACTTDSVTRFSSKVKTFVADFPEAKDDPLYPPILRNIHDAWMLLDVNGTGWDGEITIGFTFGD